MMSANEQPVAKHRIGGLPFPVEVAKFITVFDQNGP